MQNLFTSNGKVNIFGWVLFVGTIALIIFSICGYISSINKTKREENWYLRKMTEFEINLRELRGNQYKEAKA